MTEQHLDDADVYVLFEQVRGKGQRDRNALLSPGLRKILRAWYREGQAQRKMLPGGWLFPGQNPVNPLSARQLSRAFVMS